MRQPSLGAGVVVSPGIIDAYVEAARQARAHAQTRRKMADESYGHPEWRAYDLAEATKAFQRGCWYLGKARQLRRTTP